MKSKKEVDKIIKKICRGIKTKGISSMVDYPIDRFHFKKSYSVSEMEKKFNIFFCNLHHGEIIGAVLCYDTYEGLLSLIPIVKDLDNPESYFNLTEMDPIEVGAEKYGRGIYQLYTELKKL